MFINCNLASTNFYSSIFEDVCFKSCNFKNAIFDDSSLKKVKIDECNFKYASCINLKLLNTYMLNSDFSLCNFSNTSLKNIDFTTSVLDGITLYPNDLKGVILTQNQALEFIKLLGIIIKWIQLKNYIKQSLI